MLYTECVKRTTSLFVAAVALSGCAQVEPAHTSEEPVKSDEQATRDQRTDDLVEEIRAGLEIADPVELPEGIIDHELVGSWLATFSVDQEKYDERPKENQVVIDVMVADMNASKTTIELLADGTYTFSASIPVNLNNPASEMAGNSLMRGVWCVSDGKLVMVVRETAHSEPGEELPEPTPINKRMAEGALATIELSEDRKSFSEEPENRDSPYYFPVIMAFNKKE